MNSRKISQSQKTNSYIPPCIVISIEQRNRPRVIANTILVPCSGTLGSICIQVKNESHNSLVPKPTRDSKFNFFWCCLVRSSCLSNCSDRFYYCTTDLKISKKRLFRLKFPFRFRLFRFVTHGNMKQLPHSWLAHFKPRRIFYIEDILSQGSFLVVVLLTNRSKWITILI